MIVAPSCTYGRYSRGRMGTKYGIVDTHVPCTALAAAGCVALMLPLSSPPLSLMVAKACWMVGG
jgi:hypothetical protein